MSIEIEKGIPVPQNKTAMLKKMAVGDSFLLAGENTDEQKKMAGLVRQMKKRHGMLFRVKKQKGGLRIWRAD